MRTFFAEYVNDPKRARSFTIRGICSLDVLNPCWDNRKDDIPGQHWSGAPACPTCTKAANSQ